MRSLRFATATILLTLACAASSQPAAPNTQSPTALLVTGAWELNGTAQWQEGQLKVPPSPEDTPVATATRAITLPAGASWRAALTIAAVQPEAGGAALGLTLHGADGTTVAVRLRLHERVVSISRGNVEQWHGFLLEGMPVEGLTGAVTSSHSVVVESQGSRLRVSVDGREVGSGEVFDIEPVRIGVHANRTHALVKALSLEVTGSDERLARLSGRRVPPGAAVLMRESFESKLSAAGAAKAMSGLFGKMLGKTDADSSSSNDDAWGANWVNAQSRFERDTSRKRIVLEGLREDTAAWNLPASDYPLDFAGTAVTARIRVQTVGAGHRAGVMLQARPAPKAVSSDARSLITAMWGDNSLWLHEYDAGKDEWALLRRVRWPANGAVDMTLRLVTQDDKAWVFVDGRLVIHHNNVEPIKVESGGLRAEGLSRLEATTFNVSEI